MKIDFSQTFTNLEGEPLKYLDHREAMTQLLALAVRREIIDGETFRSLAELCQIKEDDSPLTLERVCVSSLISEQDKEATDPGKAKYDRHVLIGKLHAAKKPVDLKAEDVALLKKCVGRSSFICTVTGQAWDMLDGKRLLKAKTKADNGQAEKVEAEEVAQ